ncbi:MAG TPA: type II and III secretion system protein family protein [Bryobacteraceae bacterium]|nr:type II and III secretion system protein family protein [Bryobacteraceae bacterium]
MRTRLLTRILGGALAVTFSANALRAQGAEELRLTVGRSIVLDYPSDIRQISTSDPAVVDAVAVTTREVLLHAKAAGFATLIIWAKSGQRTIYSVIVEQNLDQLRKLLRETFPNETIQVQSTRDAISLTGRVSNRSVADRAVAMVTPFGKTVVNNLQITPTPAERQVLLRVKFAELDRTANLALGANLVSLGAGNTIGRTTTEQFTPPSVSAPNGRATTTFTEALNIFAFRPDLNLAAFVRALQSQGLLQILAEPNLVTTAGREASFLVGGEFPVPVLQGSGNAGAVTIQFREFGIRLTFNPTYTDNGTIKLYVKPEVSTLDFSNAVTVSGFLIPALSTRRVETNVELAEGQSFVIGGLLDERVTNNMSKIPGLADIPLLGLLFKSKEERKQRSELIVMVTPELTRPLNPGETTPMPAYPRQFLGPVAPEERQSSAVQPIEHPADQERKSEQPDKQDQHKAEKTEKKPAEKTAAAEANGGSRS